MDYILVAGIILALFFNFVNGMNDAANSIAIMVATRATSPGRAVILAAAMNLAGPFVFTVAVTETIGRSIIDPGAVTPLVIVVGLVVAIGYVLLTTTLGFPISASHALVGGLIGAALAAEGVSAIVLPDPMTILALIETVIPWLAAGLVAGAIIGRYISINPLFGSGVGVVAGAAIGIPFLMVTGIVDISGILAIVLFLVISPTLGFLCAFLFDVIISHLFRYSRQDRMHRLFQPLQVVTGAFQALGHGANDGQHASGIIIALLLSAGVIADFSVPVWVIAASAAAIAIGTCFGGWNVVMKVARQITRIRPYQGFAASTAGGGVLALMTSYGIPVSSTHIVSGAIVGVGVTRGRSAVQWNVVREILVAWVVTIPASLGVAYIAFRVIQIA